MAVWISRCWSRAPLFQENATVTCETAGRQLCKALQSMGDPGVAANTAPIQHPGASQSGFLLTHKTSAHTCRGQGQRRWLWPSLCPLEGGGEGERDREGKVPSCPGTEGSYKACSSSGPSRQAGWQGDLLHSVCRRVIPKARWWLQREGRAAGSCHNFHVVPSATLFLLITSGIREPEEGEEEEERRAAALGSCCGEREGGSREGRGQLEGGSLCHWNPQSEANQSSHNNRAFTDATSRRGQPARRSQPSPSRGCARARRRHAWRGRRKHKRAGLPGRLGLRTTERTGRDVALLKYWLSIFPRSKDAYKRDA